MRARKAQWTTEQARSRMMASHPGRRLLFINTTDQPAKSIVDSVEQVGLKVTTVTSIDQACEQQAKGIVFDTLLVDQLSIVETLRELEGLRYIPLVLVSKETRGFGIIFFFRF